MEKRSILHMFTPMAQVSPFDVNMACDAGYDVVVPYANVDPSQVAALTQDAIFSRGPKGVKRTGIFIGGRDNLLAAEMFEAARKAMVPPFEASVFVDPSGAFTTAAAMVACVQRQMTKFRGAGLEGMQVAIFGGSGPVGGAAAVLAARAGARAGLVARDDVARIRKVADVLSARYGVSIDVLDATTVTARSVVVASMDVALATAKAGARVLGGDDLARAPRLRVAADVNAVPPAGVEGVGSMDDGAPLSAASGCAVGIGALAIGNVKYQTEKGLFERMLGAGGACFLELPDALAEARRHAGLT